MYILPTLCTIKLFLRENVANLMGRFLTPYSYKTIQQSIPLEWSQEMTKSKYDLWVKISGHGPITRVIISTTEPNPCYYLSLIQLHWASWVIFFHVKNSLFCSYFLNNRRVLGFFVYTIFKVEVHALAPNTVSLLLLQLNQLQNFNWNQHEQKGMNSDALQGPQTHLIYYKEKVCLNSLG